MRRVALALSAATAALALAACSGGGADVEEGSPAPDAFTFASWSIPVEPAGEWVTSMANEEARVDIYLLGIEAAPEDSAWADTETDEPTFVAGDDVMLLQYVLTNVGEESLTLPSGEGDLGVDFVGNDYVGVPQEHQLSSLLEPFGFRDGSPIDHSQDHGGDYDMPLAAGESVTSAGVFWYPSGEELTVDFRIDRFVDGEPDYDDQVIDASVPLPIDA